MSNRHPRVTSEERARRLEAGLCFYCGEDGHQAHHCLNHPAARAGAGRGRGLRAAATVTAPTDAPHDPTGMSGNAHA